MFEFLKSPKTLEKNLRDWLVEDIVRSCGESSREDAIVISEKHERDVLEEVATSAMRQRGDGQLNHAMLGQAQPLSDVLHWSKGLRLANAFAKAKGWRIAYSGSPASGYVCTINEGVTKMG